MRYFLCPLPFTCQYAFYDACFAPIFKDKKAVMVSLIRRTVSLADPETCMKILDTILSKADQSDIHYLDDVRRNCFRVVSNLPYALICENVE